MYLRALAKLATAEGIELRSLSVFETEIRPNPGKTFIFFLENALFQDKKTLLIRLF